MSKYLGEAGTKVLIEKIKEKESDGVLIVNLDQGELDFDNYPNDNHLLPSEVVQQILTNINSLGGACNIENIVIRILFTQNFDGESLSVKYIAKSTSIMLQYFSDDYFFLNATFFVDNNASFIFSIAIAPGVDAVATIQKISFA